MVGAACAEEICWMNALTVNLHLLLASFYRPSGGRTKILMEAGAFPSDQYAAATQAKHHELDPATTIVTVAPREGERLLRTEDIVEAIGAAGESLALVLFSGVHYGTGQVFDMAAIAAAAQAAGAVVGLDLAHAVGAHPVLAVCAFVRPLPIAVLLRAGG
jgi:kynureninase